MEAAVKPSSDRLVETVLNCWEETGQATLSARRISSLSGVPVSSIYYHFGSLEQLFLCAQDAALARARSWSNEQLRQLGYMNGDVAAFPAFFSETVDGWANDRRDLAFAWREGQLLGRDSELCRQACERWGALWSDFWQQVADRFGLGSGKIVAERVFENESFFHLMRWRRLFDRAGLDELGRGLGAWLTGAPMPPSPWRDAARDLAVQSMPPIPERDEAMARMTSAAVDLVSEEGVAGLTHRAVAERAGLTLGVVLHKFNTKSELLSAAFEGVYLANIGHLLREQNAPDVSRRQTAIVDELVESISRVKGRRGLEELSLAVARDPSLHQFAAQLRYLRGRTSKSTLEAIVEGRRNVTGLEAALFSSFASSLTRLRESASPDVARAQVRTELESVLAVVRRSSVA